MLSEQILVVGGDRSEIVRTIDAACAFASQNAEYVARRHLESRELWSEGLPDEFEPVPAAYEVHEAADFLNDVFATAADRQTDLITFLPDGNVVRMFYRTPRGVPEPGRISRAAWQNLVLPEIIRRGEAAGTEFTVEVVRYHGGRAIRIWL